MKNIFNAIAITLPLLFISSQSFAKDCSINYAASSKMTTLIRENSFDFENYDKVCKLLAKANAAVDIEEVSQITPYQTSVAVSVRLVASEFDKLKLYSYSDNWIMYEEVRTSKIEDQALYELLMSAMNDISQKMVNDLDQQRAALKALRK